tara:strand:+ start:183 stop:443 length:261 start_codon:yes stop_codon:yes gene_type:complete
MILQITPTLIIRDNEIQWRFSRSSGPGGQNTNKIESQVEIIFNINKSKALNSFQKDLLLKNLKKKLLMDVLESRSKKNELNYKIVN